MADCMCSVPSDDCLSGTDRVIYRRFVLPSVREDGWIQSMKSALTKELRLRSAVGNRDDTGIRQLRSNLVCPYHMGWSIETSLRSSLLLVLFPEGVPDDWSFPFAHVTTKLAVCPDKTKVQGTAQQVLLPIALFSESSL